MRYPTLTQVETASARQIAEWYRDLPSPGSDHIGTKEFTEKIDEEDKIMTLIMRKFKENGGFSPGLSKEISWRGVTEFQPVVSREVGRDRYLVHPVRRSPLS